MFEKLNDGQATLFNYAELDTETRIVVQQRTEEIKVLVRRSAQDIIDIGGKLIEVKARLRHGNFGDWLDAEFGWTDKTAQRFMWVADKFKNDKLSNLNFGASALYLLAAPSTPEPARLEAIERAQSGEVITHRTAQNIVSEYRAVTPLNATRITLQPTPANGARSFVAPYVPSDNVGKTVYGHDLKVDVLISPSTLFPSGLIIESKWQDCAGSVDEKFPYLVLNIKERMPYPAIVVYGGGGAKSGAIAWLKRQVGGNLLAVCALEEFLSWSARNL